MKKNGLKSYIQIIYSFMPLIPLLLYRAKFVRLKMPGLASVKPYEPSLGGWLMIRTLFDKDLWIKTLSMDNQILPRELEALGVVDLYHPYQFVVLLFVVLPVIFLLAAAWSFHPGFFRKRVNKHESRTSAGRGSWLPFISIVLLLICYGSLRFYAAPTANDAIRSMLLQVTDFSVAGRFARVLSIDFGFGQAYYGTLLTAAAMIIMSFLYEKVDRSPEGRPSD